MKNSYYWTGETAGSNTSTVSFYRFCTGRLKATFMLVAAFLFISTSAFSQSDPPDPGVGGTVYGVEIDADFHSGNIPAWWSESLYSGQYSDLGTYGADWSGTNHLLNQVSGHSVPTVQSESADGKTYWQQDGNWGNKSTVAEISSFSGTSNKNGQLIDVDPYTVQEGGSGPQKNDITDLFLHTRIVDGHTIIFFGAGTRATNGASYLDFEYNQAGVTVAGGYMTGNGPHGGRTLGDFILVVNYEGGGNRPVVGYRVWQESSPGIYQWSEQLSISGDNAYITTNIEQVTAVAPGYGTAGDGSPANVTGAFQFVEGGVDITALGLLVDNPCDPEATLTSKTRSSPSFTAELKDLHVASFPLVEEAELTVTGDEVCEEVTAVLTATATGDGVDGATINWYKGSSTTALESGGDITISQSYDAGTLTSTLSIANADLSDDETYKAELSGATCDPEPETVSLDVYDNPDLAVQNLEECEDGTSAAYSFDLNSAVTDADGGSVTFYESEADAIAGTSPVASPYSASIGQTTIWARSDNSSDSDEGCHSIASFTLDVYDNPTAAPLFEVECINNVSTATISANASGGSETGYSYDWTVPVGATDPGDVAIFITTVEGTYSVVVTDSRGCVSASADITPVFEDCYGHIFPTGTECADYRDQTASELEQVCYTYKKVKGTNTVDNATPGVYFYYTHLTAPSSSFTVYVKQSNSSSSMSNADFKPFLVNNDNVQAYNNACARVDNNSGSGDENGGASVTISGVTEGDDIILRVQYDSKTIIGSTFEGNTAPPIEYSFHTEFANGDLVAGSEGSLMVTNSCSSTSSASNNDSIFDGPTDLDNSLSLIAYPNPAKEVTTIRFSSPTVTTAVLQVYSLDGRQHSILFEGEMEAGKVYEKQLQLNKDSGSVLFYILQTDFGSKTGKIMILKE